MLPIIAVLLLVPAILQAEELTGPLHVVSRANAMRTTTQRVSLRVDTQLVQVPVTVTDLWGSPYRGLNREAFQVLENGAEQRLSYFASEEAPVSMGIVFDGSGSMEGKLQQARAAVSQLLATAIAGDEFFIVNVGEVPTLLCDYTRDPDLIERSLAPVRAEDSTALLDAIYLATQHLKHAANSRRVLFILSDGGENASRYTSSEVNDLVQESDVCIYAIALARWLKLSTEEVPLLKHLTQETGGQFWLVPNLDTLPQAVWKLSEAMRSVYVLYYSSTNPSNGLYRKIRVKLRSSGDVPRRLRVSNRQGYYAPER